MTDTQHNHHDATEYSMKALQFEQLAKQVRQLSYAFSSLLTNQGVFQDLGRWGAVILSILCREEPCSIPNLQSALPLSRQYVQKEVSKLSALDLIESIDNPAHKSSKLLRPTELGLREYASRRALSMASYAEIENQFSPEELSESLLLMQKLTSVINSK